MLLFERSKRTKREDETKAKGELIKRNNDGLIAHGLGPMNNSHQQQQTKYLTVFSLARRL